MSITAIPNPIAAGPAAESQSWNASANAPTVQAPELPPAAPTDTVQLTEAERVYQLYNQGQQVTQIASTLSLSEAAVNSYLNISNDAA